VGSQALYQPQRLCFAFLVVIPEGDLRLPSPPLPLSIAILTLSVVEGPPELSNQTPK
jgi:hypothetical protein